eukprot:768566-Hanusia_phi.AAC.2
MSFSPLHSPPSYPMRFVPLLQLFRVAVEIESLEPGRPIIRRKSNKLDSETLPSSSVKSLTWLLVSPLLSSFRSLLRVQAPSDRTERRLDVMITDSESARVPGESIEVGRARRKRIIGEMVAVGRAGVGSANTGSMAFAGECCAVLRCRDIGDLSCCFHLINLRRLTKEADIQHKLSRWNTQLEPAEIPLAVCSSRNKMSGSCKLHNESEQPSSYE